MGKIAIVRRNGLGDLLCAFPLILYLQKYEPTSEITLFLDPSNAPLLSYLPPVNRVVIFPVKGNKYVKLWRTARKYRHQFDLAISSKTSPMKLMNFFLYWLKAKQQIAYVDSSWHSHLISDPLGFNQKKAAQTHQALKTLQIINAKLQDIPEELYPKLRVSHKKCLSSLPTVLVSASTTRFQSRLSPTIYANLLNSLHQIRAINVCIISQEHDRERAQEIASKLRVPYQLHIPENFDTFMLWLNSADFYFVPDGGIAHIGAALDKKAVVLYGAAHPTEWRPLSKKIKTFYHPQHVDQINQADILEALKEIHLTNCEVYS